MAPSMGKRDSGKGMKSRHQDKRKAMYSSKKAISHNTEIFKEKKKRFFMRQYRKMLKQESKSDSSATKDSEAATSNVSNPSHIPKARIKKSALQLAQEEFKRKNEERKQQHLLIEKKKSEKKEALQRYHENKKEKMKKLTKKTKHGQPVMKDRIEMLLEKIKKSVE